VSCPDSERHLKRALRPRARLERSIERLSGLRKEYAYAQVGQEGVLARVPDHLDCSQKGDAGEAMPNLWADIQTAPQRRKNDQVVLE
jgi:hypothetical protein